MNKAFRRFPMIGKFWRKYPNYWKIWMGRVLPDPQHCVAMQADVTRLKPVFGEAGPPFNGNEQNQVASGRRNENRAPWPGSLSTQMSPP